MSTVKNNIKRKKRFSYLSAIISIAMVLFMLGLFGIMLIQSEKMQTYFKENMIINVFMTDNISEEDLAKNRADILKEPFTKSLVFISKEQAARDFSLEMGQDFVSFLGYNPLMPSFLVKLNAIDNEPAKLPLIEKKLKLLRGITEVSYQQSVYILVDKNIKTIGGVLIFLASLFGLIAIVLINNTVRLNLYAQRFIIKSMQLVGATHWFIIKPFIWSSIKNGIWGWLLALAMLVTILNFLPNWIPGIENFNDSVAFAILFGGLFVVGIAISILSSWVSTKKYLNAKIEDLY
ncbi:MAG: hypothetical protein H7296_06715 [Bacteroidia bacterium]|nr:hypothetical protein [Bacteroidia bacterium]